MSREEEHSVLSVPVITTVTLLLVAVGRRAGLRDVPAPAGARSSRRSGSVAHPGGPPGPLPGRRQRGRCSCAPASTSPGSLVFVDNRGIDGAVNGLAALIGGTSGRLRRLQTGFVRSYALSMFAGAAVLVGAMLLVRL